MPQDDSGEIIEVILGYDDFKTLLQKIARETDWETLPLHLQDAVKADRKHGLNDRV